MLCLGLLVGNGWGQEAVDTDDESSHYFQSPHHFISLSHSFVTASIWLKSDLEKETR